MKIVALLSFFDESPTWLAGLVASLNGVADHLIAVDGAYWLYPNSIDTFKSDISAIQTIQEVARGIGIGCTVHVPSGPFMGNEVEKRNLTLSYGEALTTDDDWYFVIDGDEVVSHARPDLHTELAACTVEGYSVANYGIRNTVDPFNLPKRLHDQLRNESLVLDNVQPVRGLMRAIRGLRYVDAHYVVTDGSIYLCGNRDHHTLEPAADMSGHLLLDHRMDRLGPRHRARRDYYTARDELGIERITTGVT